MEAAVAVVVCEQSQLRVGADRAIRGVATSRVRVEGRLARRYEPRRRHQRDPALEERLAQRRKGHGIDAPPGGGLEHRPEPERVVVDERHSGKTPGAAAAYSVTIGRGAGP